MEFLLDKIMSSEEADLIKNQINSHNLKILEKYLKITCGISNPLFISTTNNKSIVKYRSMSGTDRKKIFEKHKLVENYFLNLGFNNITDLYLMGTDRTWNTFYDLFELSKKDLNDIGDINIFKKRLLTWLDDYLVIESSGKQTQYIHAFVSHVPDMIMRFKNINNFQCQALEKYQDLARQDFHLNTNKHSTDFIIQLLNKLNRNEIHKYPIDHSLLKKKTVKKGESKRKYNFLSSSCLN